MTRQKLQHKITTIHKIYPDLNGFEGWMDKKLDFQWIIRRFKI